MAKNLFEVVQGLFIPFLIFGSLGALVSGVQAEKIRSGFWKVVFGAAIFILIVSFLREKRFIKYNQINNIYLLVTSLVFGLVFVILSWVYSAKRLQKIEIFLLLSGLIFIFCLMIYEIPVIFALPFHFLGMYDTYFSTMYLSKFTGYLLGWLICFLSSWSFYKILSRIPGIFCKVISALYLTSGFISFVRIVGIINSYYRRKIKIPAGLRKSLPELISAENIVFFVTAAMILALAIFFFVYYTKIHGEYTNPAEHRKLKAFARNNRRAFSFSLI